MALLDKKEEKNTNINNLRDILKDDASPYLTKRGSHSKLEKKKIIYCPCRNFR